LVKKLFNNFDACFPNLWKKYIIAYEAFVKDVILLLIANLQISREYFFSIVI